MSQERTTTGSTPHAPAASPSVDHLSTVIDDAIEKLAEMSGPSPSGVEQTSIREATAVRSLPDSSPSPSPRPRMPLQLIDALLAARCRADAAAELVQTLSDAMPDAAVRCGTGAGRLSRYFDARLGWLGPESQLHEQAVDRWDDIDSIDQAGETDTEGEPEAEPTSTSKRDRIPRVIRTAGSEVLVLPEPEGKGRLVVWIDQDDPDLADVGWLNDSAGTLAAAFWSRPLHSWPGAVARLRRRSSTLITCGLICFSLIAVWPVPYRVACTARVDTIRQRIIASPFEASLLSANFRPGDTVRSGDTLVTLDGRPLRLERESIDAEIQQVSKEHDVALATGRIADAQQSKLKGRKLDRRFEMLTDRLKRLEVVSPIDGVVVSGDLERYVGAPLELGQTLMEIAPLDYMVVEVEIPAHEINYVRRDAETRVRIDSVGGKSLRMRLDELSPVAELRDDRNVFVGRINVANGELQLKPGMRGEAIAYGPLRPWIWSWVRGGVEKVLWWVGY
jgi:hypothetical protein